LPDSRRLTPGFVLLMLKAIFTLDYEIHGNGDGCSYELMVEPTRRMLDQFDRYGAKLTIMADVAEILKFKEYKEQFGRDDYHYDAIAQQLQDAIRRGHDVQLHLHASYFNARFEGGRWRQDWSEYNFAGLPLERINQVVRIGKEYLESLLRPVAPSYQCMAFRAANWSVSPSRNVIRALHDNGIRVETSVFKYGRREGIVSFDYSHAPSDLVPWRVADDDVCRRDDAGKLLEIPIYCERRWLGAFLTPNRVYRALQTRSHRIASREYAGPNVSPGAANGRSGKGRLARKFGMLTQLHPWKADFNQCSGGQLIRALERAAARHGHEPRVLPFVLIGHSKIFTRFNERSLRPFLEFVQQHPDRFGFARLAEAESFAA
jgi:hypothetical protein